MTTRIKIANEGPESASVWFYKEDRTFHELGRLVKVGETMEIDVWNGYLPVVMLAGNVNIEEDLRLFRVPPVPEPSADAVREAAQKLVDHLWRTPMHGIPFHLVTDLRSALAASSKELVGKPSCRDSGMGWCEIQHIDGGKFCDNGQCLKYKYDGSPKD